MNMIPYILLIGKVVAFSGNGLELLRSSVHAWTRPIEKMFRPGQAKDGYYYPRRMDV